MASGGGSLGSTLSPKLLALQSAAAIPNLPSHTDANVRSIAAAASAAGRPVGSAALNAAAAPNSQTAISQHDRNAARKADMYAVGKLVAARAQRERQGDAVATQLMTEADGIPVKEALQTMYRVTRNKTMVEALIFIVNFVLLLVVCFGIFDVHSSFVANQSVRQQLVNRALPGSYWKKTFFDVGQPPEIENFFGLDQLPDGSMEVGPFISYLFPTQLYGRDTLSPIERLYVGGGNMRLLGGVEFRVVMVNPDSCSQLPGLPAVDGVCYGQYNEADQFRGTLVVNNNTYFFGTRHASSLRGLSGAARMQREITYGPYAYSTILPAGDIATAVATMQRLTSDGILVHPGVRAIGATFNLFNTNTRLVTVCRLIVEVLETGTIIPSVVMFTVSIPELFLALSEDAVMVAVMVAYCLMWVYYAVKEGRRFYWSQPRADYWRHPINVFEVGLLVMQAVFIVLWIIFFSEGSIIQPVDVNRAEYNDIYDLAWQYTDVFAWAGIVALLSALKIFRYMSINKRMSTLWLTLYRARSELLAFSVSLLVCLLAFGFFGNQAFGHRLYAYKDYGTALTTLLQYVLGSFQYETLVDARPWIAWVYFGLYICIVNIVVINLIIAIATKYFAEVQDDIRRVDKWKESTTGLEQEVFVKVKRALIRFWRHLRNSCCCCCYSVGRRRWSQRKLCWCVNWDRLKRWVRREEEVDKRAPTSGSGPVSSRNAADGSGSVGAGVDDDDIDDLEDFEVEEMLQMQQWDAETRFVTVLHTMSTLSKRINNMDLFTHFERLYEDTPGSDALFMGVHELCSLCRSRPCIPTAHIECEARSLVSAYHNMKLVLMVGRCQKHKPISDEVKENLSRVFTVQLMTRYGNRNERKLLVDEDRGLLLCFDTKNVLIRQLPLTQLLQLEKSSTESGQVTLVFTSQGMSIEDEEVAGSLEIALQVRFKNDTRRDAFLEMVLDTQSKLQAEYESIMGALLAEHGGARR